MLTRRKFIRRGALLVPVWFAPNILIADRRGLLARRNAESGGAASCTAQKDQQTGTTASNQLCGAGGNQTYEAGKFTAGSSYTICKVVLRLGTAGTPTFTIAASIYTDNAGLNQPGTIVGSEGSAASVAGMGTNATEQDFTLSGLSSALTNATAYWIVLRCISSPNNFADYVKWFAIGGGATDIGKNSADASTWGSENPFAVLKFTSYA